MDNSNLYKGYKKLIKEYEKLTYFFLISIAITVIVFLLCIYIRQFINSSFLYDSFGYGTFGDFIGGFIGTVAAIATLIVVYKSFNQVNEQSLQNTVALLMQSYQHTIEDYDYIVGKKSITITGREGIQRLLENEFKRVYLPKIDFTKVNPRLETWLTNRFPTHIPAIIVSILHTIKDKNEFEKQIKSMLSYEERKLLLIFLLEQRAQNDKSFNDDWPKIKSLLIKDDSQPIPSYLKDYTSVIDNFNLFYKK